MKHSYDVVIIGGGVVGSSIAYHLSANSAFSGRVAVIERDPTYAASSLSTSAIRQQFGTPPNIRMSAYSIEFLRRVREMLSVEGFEANIGLREPGYLILGTPDQVPGFQAKNANQRACGIKTELLDQDQMYQRHPWLRVDDLGIGSYGSEKEGWFDGPALLQAFKRKARSQGYLARAVMGLEMAGAGQVGAVLLSDGGRVACGTVVNAAGPWSSEIGRMAGSSYPWCRSSAASSCSTAPRKYRMPRSSWIRAASSCGQKAISTCAAPPRPARTHQTISASMWTTACSRTSSGPRSRIAFPASSSCACFALGRGYTNATFSTIAASSGAIRRFPTWCWPAASAGTA